MCTVAIFSICQGIQYESFIKRKLAIQLKLIKFNRKMRDLRGF